MFDHGCDAFTAGFVTIIMMKALGLGNSDYLLVGILAVTQSFHFTCLEQYYTGGLFLGVINGVTDGSLLIVGVFIYLGMFGNSLFTHIYSFYMGNTFVSYSGAQLFILGVLFS